AKLLKANPELLTGGEKFIQQADVNGKTVYRLRVGSFASKADAATFCAAFKAKGGNCYPALK
ncbi:MAG: SPOR domain-containing protein, partial [Hyphomonadaceae bacterium]